MPSKIVSRLFAVLLAASITLPTVCSVSPVVSAQSIETSSWSVSVTTPESVLPNYVQAAFSQAMESYNGAELIPLAYYGYQVVSGANYSLICRETSDTPGNDVLKKVVVYDPTGGNLNLQTGKNARISSVTNFRLEDYAHDFVYPLPEYPPAGGTEVASGLITCDLPEEVQKVYDKVYKDICGFSCQPLAYLGKQVNDEGTDYALLCEQYTVVANPDIFIDVVIFHEDADGKVYVKSSCSILGTRTAYPIENGKLTYTFDGDSKEKAGYAQGSLTLTADTAGTYKIYWADFYQALEGYYPIAELKMKAGETKTISLGYHTAIPANATKVIATTDSLSTMQAYSVCDIPMSKELACDSGNLLYTFNTFSDVHIDKGSLWYVNAEANLKQALKYSTERQTDYIIISGDVVTNDSGPDKEWDSYAKILSKSDYTNPVWESNGNHDMRQDVTSGLKSFVKGSGTDGSKSGKPYFYMTEEKTGDLFIFMALELNKSPNLYDEFSDEQIAWVTNLIEENYADKNIFLVQHSPIKGFGAGDRMENPYYSGLLNPEKESTKKFKALLEKYPNIMFLSGHTHEDFEMNYNYSNENGTAAHMIHTPSLAGSTMPDESDTGLARNNGKGFNSQAYRVEVYENEIIFYGVNMTDEKIYPQYSYIMEGSRTEFSPVLPDQPEITLQNINVSASEELEKVASILSRYYKYASYDSYQALKKLYFQYKDSTLLDKGIIDEFEARINKLSEYTGTINYYSLRDTYYFVNNQNWSEVYAYAWDGSSSNASWPGVKIQKVGVNEDNKDIYCVKFNSVGEYKNLIFNAGSNAKQTVDISLESCAYDSFYISGSDNGKYTVQNFSQDDYNQNRFALLYYITDEHTWENIDLFFHCGDDGIYRAEYTASSDKTFSCSVYDNSSNKYYSLSASDKFTFENQLTYSYTLEEMSSRGKSISVYGLSDQATLQFTYDPSTHQITVLCKQNTPVTELENTSDISAQEIKLGNTITVHASAAGGTGNYTYEVAYKKTYDQNWVTKQSYQENTTVSIKPNKAEIYDIRVRVKDDSGTEKEKYFTVKVTDVLKNSSTVSASSVILGDTVTINAKATGGTGEYTYAVYYKKTTDKNWVTKQNYSTNQVITIKPAKKAEYQICVKVKDSEGTVSKLYYNISVSEMEKLTNTTTLSANTITLGNTVKVNASAKGGKGGYTYAVYYKKTIDKNWVTKQAYTSNQIISIKPAKKAEYQICVKVKDSEGTVSKLYFTVNVE